MVHSKQRGGEVIVGHKSHILLWEQGGASQVQFCSRILLFIYLEVSSRYLLPKTIINNI